MAKAEIEMKLRQQPVIRLQHTDSLDAAQGIGKPLVPPLNPGSRVENFTALQAVYCKPGRVG